MIRYKAYVSGIRPFLFNKVYSDSRFVEQFQAFLECQPEVSKTTVSYSPFTFYIHFKDREIDTLRFKMLIRDYLKNIIVSLKDQVLTECEVILSKCSSHNTDPSLLYDCILNNINDLCDMTVIASGNTPVLGVLVL